MNNISFSSNKTDLFNNTFNIKNNIIKKTCNNKMYSTIIFDNINKYLEKTLKKEILFFFNKLKVNNNSHILVVGIGNENYIADAIGPKTIKHIKVNSYLDNLGIDNPGIKVSTLEPGVLLNTGILTSKIIKSVVKEIKPDIVIIIDSFISNNLNDLNRTIEISNDGIKTNGGIFGNLANINKNSIGIPVISIGVTTALILNDNYILSLKNIDDYVLKISEFLGNVLNEVIYNLK